MFGLVFNQNFMFGFDSRIDFLDVLEYFLLDLCLDFGVCRSINKSKINIRVKWSFLSFRQFIQHNKQTI